MRASGAARPSVSALVIIIALVMGGYVLSSRPGSILGVAGRVQNGPAVIYGISAGSRLYENGGEAACTEMAFRTDSQRWVCMSWDANVNGYPVRPAKRYDGQCAHTSVDQQRREWVCLSVTPLPPQSLPTVPVPPPGTSPST